MFYQQPPVGRRVKLKKALDNPEELFKPYWTSFYSSGTAALAAAIQASINLKEISHPEVIIPAYGCPDLVSAVVFAGAKPVLVDLEHNRPWFNIEQLKLKLCKKTVAVVAVNLFGIKERIDQIRNIIQDWGVLLIEDSAQLFPNNNISEAWDGDLIIISFGRGKPINLLGGGAVLGMEQKLKTYFTSQQNHNKANKQQWLKFGIKANLYNLMIKPELYWIPNSIPLLHIGETKYKELKKIENMDSVRYELIYSNIKSYMDEGIENQELLSEIMENACNKIDKIKDLPRLCKITNKSRLLRYPIIVEKMYREHLYTTLINKGLGISKMYQRSLVDIPGLEKILEGQDGFTEAKEFSKKLLTLPIHEGITTNDMRIIEETFIM